MKSKERFLRIDFGILFSGDVKVMGTSSMKSAPTYTR